MILSGVALPQAAWSQSETIAPMRTLGDLCHSFRAVSADFPPTDLLNADFLFSSVVTSAR